MEELELRVGQKIEIITSPTTWTSELSTNYPLNLSFPRMFIVNKIGKKEKGGYNDCYIPLCLEDTETKEEYGFSISNTGLTVLNTKILNKTSNVMQKLNLMFKKLVDKDVQTLYKAGFIDGDLLLTSEGRENLFAILFEANKAELVKLAEEKIAEEEKKKD